MDEPRKTMPYPASEASDKLDRLQSRPLLRSLLRLFTQKPDDTLLAFDQVQALLKSRSEIDRGTQVIPLCGIVGSVGRYRDFDRAFLPLTGANQERWKRLDIALNELSNVPPIDVYQIGEVYFVRDGNHRVSVAKANGLDSIEANVTEIESRVPLTPNIDLDSLIIKIEYARFLEVTRLDETRPDQHIELTAPGSYDTLLEHIDVHRYYLGLEWNREFPVHEGAASWFDIVYEPVVRSIHESGILREFPHRSEADLYLWVAYHRERLRERYGASPTDRDIAAGLAKQFSDRPIVGFVKTIVRAMHAAMQAASESPEPPTAEFTAIVQDATTDSVTNEENT